MPELVEVRFKGNRKDYYSWDNSESLVVGHAVIVEAERGVDLGTVSALGALAERKCGVGCNGCALTAPKTPKGRVVRNASVEEARQGQDLRRSEEEARRKVIERVRARGLPMKVSDAEWQWDRKKLTVYFTAEQRIDFRELVRDLAASFHTRIELRQIGARDEAKRLDGVGRCGRQYCCSSWLPELKPVSLSLAKDQRLSLNPQQISGGCGRLLCCLRYEHDFYVESRKRFPKEGKILNTPLGPERVQAVDIFRERVLLSAESGSARTITLAQLTSELRQAGGLEEPGPEPEPLEPETAQEIVEEEIPVIVEEPAETEVTPRPRRRRRRRRRRTRGGGGEGEGRRSPDQPPRAPGPERDA